MSPPFPVFVPGGPVSKHPLNDGLLAWWLAAPPRDGAQYLYDLVGASHAGIYNGASWSSATPRPGGCRHISLTAATHRVGAVGAYGRLISSRAAHTSSFWLLVRSFANEPVVYCDGTNTTDFFCELRASGAGIYWGYSGSYRTYSGWSMATNQWYHICLVKTGAGDSGTAYLNGLPMTSYTGTMGNNPTGTQDLWWGNYGSAGLQLDGAVDDMRVYGRALSAAEVSGLYRQSLLGHPETLRYRRERAWLPPPPPPDEPVETAKSLAWSGASLCGPASSLLWKESSGVDRATSAVWFTYQTGILDRLMAHWPLDDVHGADRADSSGRNITLTPTFRPSTNASVDFYIGTSAGNSPFTHGFPGAVARLGKWDRKLTGAEKTSLYNSAAGQFWSAISAGTLGDAKFYYNLDEATGSGAGNDRVDATGRNTPITVVGAPTQVTGPDGTSSAIHFDGSTQRGFHADSADFRTGYYDHTISFFFRMDSASDSSNVDYILGKVTAADAVEWLFYYRHAIGDKKLWHDLGYSSTDPDLWVSRATTYGDVPATTWLHVLFEYDATANTTTLSINGTADSYSPVSLERVSGIATSTYAMQLPDTYVWDGTQTTRAAARSAYRASPGTDVLSGGDVSHCIAGWFKLDSTTHDMHILGKWERVSDKMDWSLRYIAASDLLRFEVSDGGSNYAVTGVSLNDTNTHHVYAEYDADANTISISLDGGALTDSDTVSFTPAATNTNFTIGAFSDGTNVSNGWKQFVGKLAGWSRWKGRVLTSDEKTTLYNGGTYLAYPFPTGTPVFNGPSLRWALAALTGQGPSLLWADLSSVTPSVALPYQSLLLAGEDSSLAWAMSVLAAQSGSLSWLDSAVVNNALSLPYQLSTVAGPSAALRYALSALSSSQGHLAWRDLGLVDLGASLPWAEMNLSGAVGVSTLWDDRTVAVGAPSFVWGLGGATEAFLSLLHADRVLVEDGMALPWQSLQRVEGQAGLDWALRSLVVPEMGARWADRALTEDGVGLVWRSLEKVEGQVTPRWALRSLAAPGVGLRWADLYDVPEQVILNIVRFVSSIRRRVRS